MVTANERLLKRTVGVAGIAGGKENIDGYSRDTI